VLIQEFKMLHMQSILCINGGGGGGGGAFVVWKNKYTYASQTKY